MKKATVILRGLFVLVRHAKNPEAATRAGAEPMTVLFPAAPSHDHHHGDEEAGPCICHGEHVPTLFIPTDGSSQPSPKRRKGSADDSTHYLTFPLPRCELSLPLTSKQQAVAHKPDKDIVLRTEPKDCGYASADDGNLSRFANLNDLTGSSLDPAHLGFPAAGVAARVVLSGGSVSFQPSATEQKPLADAFFEFYDDEDGTSLVIRQMAEDLKFEVDVEHDDLTVGFKSLDDGGAKPIPIRMPVTSRPIVIASLPPQVKCRDLLSTIPHFRLLYDFMMRSKGKRPNIRYIARCDGRALSHTMPEFIKRTNDPPCSCFGAQVFYK